MASHLSCSQHFQSITSKVYGFIITMHADKNVLKRTQSVTHPHAGHSQILSHSRGENLGEGLGTLLRHGLEMVDSFSM